MTDADPAPHRSGKGPVAAGIFAILLLVPTFLTIHGMATKPAGHSRWTRVVKTTTVARNVGIHDRIYSLPANASPRDAEAALGAPDRRETDGDLEAWRYDEKLEEEQSTYLLGWIKVGHRSESRTEGHSVFFQGGTLLCRQPGDPIADPALKARVFALHSRLWK